MYSALKWNAREVYEPFDLNEIRYSRAILNCSLILQSDNGVSIMKESQITALSAGEV